MMYRTKSLASWSLFFMVKESIHHVTTIETRYVDIHFNIKILQISTGSSLDKQRLYGKWNQREFLELKGEDIQVYGYIWEQICYRRLLFNSTISDSYIKKSNSHHKPPKSPPHWYNSSRNAKKKKGTASGLRGQSFSLLVTQPKKLNFTFG